jgi:predicted RND superfamily exporter protein
MWYKTGRFILHNRLLLLTALFVATLFMGWKASKVQLSYDFTRALPTDNPKYRDYQNFLKKFGADNNTMVIGTASEKFYTPAFFNEVARLYQQLKNVNGVTEVLSIPEAVTLQNDSVNHRLIPVKIFSYPYTSQQALDSAKAVFENLPFYKGILYNFPISQFQNSKILPAYLTAVSVNKDTINSKSRTRLMNDILAQVKQFETRTGTTAFTSGLPYIRTSISNRIKDEMNWFLIGSLILSAITLLFFSAHSAP